VPWLQVTIIDFPQMVSVGHANARELFQRDVECIVRFFKRKVRQQTPALLR
jgi:RIO kinase 2